MRWCGPLTVAAKYVDQISKGDIPAKITDTYKGDFNEMKNNLNACIDAVQCAWWPMACMLVKASLEGKLATRADASKHQGDYRKIVQGVNEMLDAVVGPLTVCRQVCGPDLQGQHPGEDHGHLQGRLQRDEEQPEHVHRCRATPWWPMSTCW